MIGGSQLRGLGAAAVLAAASVVGCGGQSAPMHSTRATPRESVLEIGVVPEQNIFRQLDRYQRLLDALGPRAGVRFEIRPLPSYATVIETFRDSDLSGAFLGSFVYAVATDIVGLEPVARPEGADGRSTYCGLILVRAGSGIVGVDQLRGKRFAFVDKATSAGYLFPLEFFAEHGVTDPRRFLGESYFAGTHEDVILDVFNGKADAGAAKDTVLERMAAAQPEIGRALAVIARSPEFPDNALALRTSIDPAVRARIREAMLRLADDAAGRSVLEAFGARRFVPTSDADYEPVIRYSREVGLDLDRSNPKTQP